jgi:hypothetical protein
MRTPKLFTGLPQWLQTVLSRIAVQLHWTEEGHPNQPVELAEMVLVLPILVASMFGLAYLVWSANCSLACAMVFVGISTLVAGGFVLFDRIVSQS